MNDDTSIDPINAAFADFKKRLIQGERDYWHYRQIFLDACYKYADNLRARSNLRTQSAKSDEEIEKLVLEICGDLTSTRDHIVDWVLLESKIDPSEDFGEALLNMLNRLFELRSQQSGVNTDIWIKAHHAFVYEIFLYIVAALMKTDAFNTLHDVFHNRYLKPETEAHGTKRFTKFDFFWCNLKELQIKQQAKRTDLPFEVITEAELLIFMMACITKNVRWHPQILNGSSPRNFPFFFNATQQRGFKKIAKITGIENADELREVVKTGLKRVKTNERDDFCDESWERMNMNNMDNMDKLEKID